MRRARKRSVGALVATAALAAAPCARAFHAGAVFDKPAGAGGGGGIFYTGALAEHRWDCTACHTQPAGAIKVTLAADPPALLETLRYTPGATYAFKASLDGEHLGAGPANFNAIALAFVGPDGAPAGDISGYAADELYAGRGTIVSAGQHPGETRWAFTWTAPADPNVRVKLHVAAVDGNGAGGQGDGTLTDPWGDDVFVGALTFDSGAAATGARPHDARWAMFGLACVLGLRRRRTGGWR